MRNPQEKVRASAQNGGLMSIESELVKAIMNTPEAKVIDNQELLVRLGLPPQAVNFDKLLAVLTNSNIEKTNVELLSVPALVELRKSLPADKELIVNVGISGNPIINELFDDAMAGVSVSAVIDL